MKRIGCIVGFAVVQILFIGEAFAMEWSVVDAGAVGDGATDNTAVFQQVLNEAGKAGGGIVQVPAGRYRIEGTLSIPAAVTLKGVFTVPPTSSHEGSPHLHGTVLLAYAGRGSQEGEPFIRLGGHMACLSGVIITYPEWSQEDVPPVPYPPCIFAQDVEDVGVLDCCLINPYEGIRFIRAYRHLVRNVFGYPSWRGFYVDECYDIGKVENCHFWPFGVLYQPDNPYCKWVNTNAVAFEFKRTDWHYVLNTFCFGYGVGYKFSESPKGSCNGNFLGIGADSCRRAILVEQAQDPGLLITNGELVGRWGSTDSVCLEIAESARGKVSLTNCSFWGPIDRCVWHRSAKAQFTANACNFVHWDNTNKGSPAIQIDKGAAIVQGNTFGAGDLNVLVGEEVRSAILMGNQAPLGFRVQNHAGKKTQLIGNEEDPVAWTDEARKHYVLHLGADGDGRYLRGWHGPEGVNTSRWRWSTASSDLILPIAADTEYEIALSANIPEHAIGPESGLYLGEERIANLASGGAGNMTVKAVLAPQAKDVATITLRVKDWIPSQVGANENDDRRLGVQVFSVTLRAKGADKRLFDANTGEWGE